MGFEPHGLEFSRPAFLIIDLSRTGAADNPTLLDDLVGVYFEGEPGTHVMGREVLPVGVWFGRLVLSLDHFSGYLLATG